MVDIGDTSSSLKTYQICQSNEGWQPILVASETKPIDYTVMVSPWGDHKENICYCPGYIYRGTCRHQIEASKKVCRWNELISEEQQSDEQRKTKTCPRCGGPTRWQLEVVNDTSS